MTKSHPASDRLSDSKRRKTDDSKEANAVQVQNRTTKLEAQCVRWKEQFTSISIYPLLDITNGAITIDFFECCDRWFFSDDTRPYADDDFDLHDPSDCDEGKEMTSLLEKSRYRHRYCEKCHLLFYHPDKLVTMCVNCDGKSFL